MWVEIGLRAKSDVRMRCIFQYRREDDEGASSVQRVFLVREGLERLPPKDKMTEVNREDVVWVGKGGGWGGVGRCSLVWCRVVSCGVVWCDEVWGGVELCVVWDRVGWNCVCVEWSMVIVWLENRNRLA